MTDSTRITHSRRFKKGDWVRTAYGEKKLIVQTGPFHDKGFGPRMCLLNDGEYWGSAHLTRLKKEKNERS